MYVTLGVSYLLDIEDTVSHYENKGRAKRINDRGVQRELDALSSLDRITRTEVVHGKFFSCFHCSCFCFFFRNNALSKKFGVTQHTQHRLYSHNTFILQMSHVPE